MIWIQQLFRQTCGIFELIQEQLTQSMFDHIPVGVGSKGVIPITAQDLEEALEMGVDWSLREGDNNNSKVI